MYESVYAELEKVRKMLIVEYDMNRELVKEVSGAIQSKKYLFYSRTIFLIFNVAPTFFDSSAIHLSSM